MATQNSKRAMAVALAALILACLTVAVITTNRIQRERNNRLLIAALKRNDTTRVLSLLNGGAEANASDTGTDTRSFQQHLMDLLQGRKPLVQGPCALLVAVEYRMNVGDPPDNVEAIEALLDHGATCNVHGEDGFTPLIIAAGTGKLKTVRLLIDRGQT